MPSLVNTIGSSNPRGIQPGLEMDLELLLPMLFYSIALVGDYLASSWRMFLDLDFPSSLHLD